MTEKVDAKISAMENNQVYIVPTTKIEIEEKIGKDQQPRFLEDEGMYIGIKPVIPKSKNHNKMEQRILKEQNDQPSKWFGTDGKLVALPNPLRKKPTRPANLDDDSVSSNDPLTYFCPPSLPGPDGLPMAVNPAGYYYSYLAQTKQLNLNSIFCRHFLPT